MRYWWVNQNQTFKQEFGGGYLWSPKRKVNGGRNPFYEHMREVSPGDLVISFSNTVISAVGVARSYAYESPKPAEFGDTGPNWSAIGWRVDVAFSRLQHHVRPADHIHALRPLLPSKYSPLQLSGRGNQGVYLTVISERLMKALAGLIGPEIDQFMRASASEIAPPGYSLNDGQLEWETHLHARLEEDTSLDSTEKEQVVLARRGQGRFKRNVQLLERSCRITEVSRVEHLRASHIRPWRACETNQDRLDGENGLLLTPSVDHLFDRGFISFENNGELLVSPVLDQDSLKKMGVPAAGHKCGSFSVGQKEHMEFHRESVFLKSSLV